MKLKRILLTFLLFGSLGLSAQLQVGDNLGTIDYQNPKSYIIGGVTVTGVQNLDPNVLIMLSGLRVSDRIDVPGEKIRTAIQKLWAQGLFEDVGIYAAGVNENDMIFLNIRLKERPRLLDYRFAGLKKSEEDDIKSKINLIRGDVVTEHIKQRTENIIEKHFTEKGFLNTKVDIREVGDTMNKSSITLVIDVDKNDRVKIENINFVGNENLSDARLKRAMKETKQKGGLSPFDALDKFLFKLPLKYLKGADSASSYFDAIVADHLNLQLFKSSKYIPEKYREDKLKIIEAYNNSGYRDAEILKDSLYFLPNGNLALDIHVDEGPKYYFGDITWVGNTKFSSEQLASVLNIKKGDVYNQKELNANLNYNPNSVDVSALYMDNGYLFFSIDPVEKKIYNDTIDIEMRIREGKPATINKVTIKGNTTTKDHVVLREIRTRPGELFSRDAIIRTTRELAQLKYFNQEKINPVPKPNPADGTVDIEYQVEEMSNDQIELSGGYGGYYGIMGKIGLSFNNFAAKDIFKKSAYRPVPTGDGQKLSLSLQKYGKGFTVYSVSFMEPWLGGKKPNAFGISFNSSNINFGLTNELNPQKLRMDGLMVSLGRRLQVPDDYFQLQQRLNYSNYAFENYRNFALGSSNAKYTSFSYGVTLGRYSIDNPLYARNGSDISLSLDITPPYSLFNNKDYTGMSAAERFRWLEFHKWKFNASYFKQVYGDLVISARTRYGFLGAFNKEIGVSPVDRFWMGGSGMQMGSYLEPREIISLRGYKDLTVTPDYYREQGSQGSILGGTIFNKNILEVRYPVSLQQSTIIYLLGFAEAGNTWADFKSFNPFSLKRSAGVGIRVFLPMFGMLGMDWGYGFDPIPGVPDAHRGNFQFSIGQNID